MLGLSVRQVRRLRRAVERRGAAGVVHGNHGARAEHRVTEEVRTRIVELRRKKYEGFNDQHFTEKLGEVEGVKISRASVQRLLRAAGIGPPRKRRAPKHRRRRDRKAQAGLMILWDGSRHDWLEGRGPMLCLMGAVDDATGELLPGAHFVEQECAAGYLTVLKAIAAEKGLPWSAYMDQHGSLKRNDDHWTLAEELRGAQEPTQVGRALQALEIEVIYALSPQAKGRVERLWGTLQDRLVSELRLGGGEYAWSRRTRCWRCTVRTTTGASRFARPTRRPRGARCAAGRISSGSAASRTRRRCSTTTRCGWRASSSTYRPGPASAATPGRASSLRQLLDASWRVYLGDTVIATAAASSAGELRALRRHRRRPPSAASVGKTPVALRAPSVSPTELISS